MNDFYNMIFKRKSFHTFKNTIPFSEDELNSLSDFFNSVVPLFDNIKTRIKIVPSTETSCQIGNEYCINFYSEVKDGYLMNIGYIGQQIDFYLASKNIGACWYGWGKTQDKQDGFDFVIMIGISKALEDQFRTKESKVKRLAVSDFWTGDTLGIAEDVKFAPSACNSQPWACEVKDNKLYVYRTKPNGAFKMIPFATLQYFNKIDIGIFLENLEECLKNKNIKYDRELFDNVMSTKSKRKAVAIYTLHD